MTDNSHAIFLSYDSQDAAAADRICVALSSAGIEVFLDQSELWGKQAAAAVAYHNHHEG